MVILPGCGVGPRRRALRSIWSEAEAERKEAKERRRVATAESFCPRINGGKKVKGEREEINI